MRTRVLWIAWSIAAVALIAIAVVRWRRVDAPAPVRLVIPSVHDERRVHPATELDSNAVAIVDNDPFRLANEPSPTRYSLAPAEPAAVTTVARAQHPNLTLRGIAGGPPWQALVDGIPGQTHVTLVHVGSVVDKLVVRAITRDTVVIRGVDTTWVLRFARRS